MTRTRWFVLSAALVVCAVLALVSLRLRPVAPPESEPWALPTTSPSDTTPEGKPAEEAEAPLRDWEASNIGILSRRIHDDDPAIRAAAALALVQLGSPSAMAALLDRLGPALPPERAAILHAAETSLPAEARQAFLANAAQHPVLLVREGALSLLRAEDTDIAARMIAHNLGSPEPTVRAAALAAMERTNVASRDELRLAVAKLSAVDVRIAYLRALFTADEPPPAEALLAVVTGRDRSDAETEQALRQQVTMALGSPHSVPLEDFVRAGIKSPPPVPAREVVLAACAQRGEPTAEAIAACLLRATPETPADTVRYWISALAATGSPQALPALEHAAALPLTGIREHVDQARARLAATAD